MLVEEKETLIFSARIENSAIVPQAALQIKAASITPLDAYTYIGFAHVRGDRSFVRWRVALCISRGVRRIYSFRCAADFRVGETATKCLASRCVPALHSATPYPAEKRAPLTPARETVYTPMAPLPTRAYTKVPPPPLRQTNRLISDRYDD